MTLNVCLTGSEERRDDSAQKRATATHLFVCVSLSLLSMVMVTKEARVVCVCF